MKIGRRLTIKLLNASKFILGSIPEPSRGAVASEPVDLAMLAGLAQVVTDATGAYEAFDYATALETAEKFFWQFCDDYLELVKERAYNADGNQNADSARAALRLALDVQLRLFAPTLPFVTEEVWSWWREGSIHRATWPEAGELPTGGDPAVLDAVASALVGIRGAKSNAKASMKAEVSHADISGPDDTLAALRTVETDLRAVGRITGTLTWTVAEGPLQVGVELAQP